MANRSRCGRSGESTDDGETPSGETTPFRPSDRFEFGFNPGIPFARIEMLLGTIVVGCNGDAPLSALLGTFGNIPERVEPWDAALMAGIVPGGEAIEDTY